MNICIVLNQVIIIVCLCLKMKCFKWLDRGYSNELVLKLATHATADPGAFGLFTNQPSCPLQKESTYHSAVFQEWSL